MINWMKSHKLIVASLCLAIGILLFVPPVWMLHTGVVTVTQWTKKKGETEAKVGPKHPGWISSKNVSRHVFHAIVTAEDARFYQHHGLDFEEIIKSANLNMRRGKYSRGASTITQQVVKMAFLTRKKSIIRKAREAIGALLLELIMDKTEILEWYINLAEFGDNVYGIKAASSHYFQTKPEQLTISQAAHLALVLPAPNSWSFGLRKRSLTSFGVRRYTAIINGMRKNGYITDNQWLQALANGNFGQPVPSYDRALAQYNLRNTPAGDTPSITKPETIVERELMSTDARAVEPGPEEKESKLDQEDQMNDDLPPDNPAAVPPPVAPEAPVPEAGSNDQQ